MVAIFRQYVLKHGTDEVMCWLIYPANIEAGKRVRLEGGTTEWTVVKRCAFVDGSKRTAWRVEEVL